jgi:hypothetical protein
MNALFHYFALPNTTHQHGETMMKRLLSIFMILFVPVVASAQSGWTYAGVFPDSTKFITGIHGLAVDKDNKVWVGVWTSAILQAAQGDQLPVRRNFVRVLNPDGTEASFSPIVGVTLGDSLLRFGSITGVSSDKDGNVWLSQHGYRVNSATENGGTILQPRSWIHKFSPSGERLLSRDVTIMRTETVAHAPNRVSVTDDGDIVVSMVWTGSPIKVFSGTDLSEITTVTESSLGFARTLSVSPDGKMIYTPFYGGAGGSQGVGVYKSADGVFGSYTIDDDLTFVFSGSGPGAAHVYPPNPNILYITGAGGNNDPLARAPWNSTRVYGVSVNSGEVVDSLAWDYGTRTAYVIPRAMAISADGLTMYLGTFSTGTPGVQKFTRQTATSLPVNETPTGFALSQNYPNPFNPSTRISFSIPQAGDVTLKVYDMLGREVATLVNGAMAAGTHSATFDASGMSSGIYLYELRSGNTRITNKMTLMK